MGVLAKHAYKTGFLKSEKWQNIRVEALGKFKGKCFICGFFSIHNHVHHRYYPPNIWRTTIYNCVLLCRFHHWLVHRLYKNRKVSWTELRKLKKLFDRSATPAERELVRKTNLGCTTKNRRDGVLVLAQGENEHPSQGPHPWKVGVSREAG